MMKKIFKDVTPQIDFIKLEHSVLEFWEERDVFKNSLIKTKGRSHGPLLMAQ